jgi:polyisoprenyl-phosphate glycosyltransferase
MIEGVDVAVVTPAYGNQATLPELARRVAAVLDGRTWRLRVVVDASPDTSLTVARELAAGDSRISVTALAQNVGQHRALARGLAEEAGAEAWVCLDADLQDPPEAVPALLTRLAMGDVAAVFAGRRGDYESRSRLLTGRLHRAAMGRVTGLPPDAGAFVAMGPNARRAVLKLGGPSIVAALGASGLPLASVPVERQRRSTGESSSWTAAARLRQSARTLAWAAAHRRQPAAPAATRRRASVSAFPYERNEGFISLGRGEDESPALEVGPPSAVRVALLRLIGRLSARLAVSPPLTPPATPTRTRSDGSDRRPPGRG